MTIIRASMLTHYRVCARGMCFWSTCSCDTFGKLLLSTCRVLYKNLHLQRNQAKHAWTEQHQVDWPTVTVLSNPTNHTSRLVKEALTIRNTANTLNTDTGTLPTEYDNLC